MVFLSFHFGEERASGRSPAPWGTWGAEVHSAGSLQLPNPRFQGSAIRFEECGPEDPRRLNAAPPDSYRAAPGGPRFTRREAFSFPIHDESN